ncbi:hypothetical protein GCM10010094_17200 [Streptomyces flaveus]|uniref:Uncharacterized protein n=1 Tax=Streptomyces flaveus TaxID=66370 RepID=A0A917QLT3_9ACTN|nr:hypothetical protein GCM10010094_17200 [Streptomyces flaveus]
MPALAHRREGSWAGASYARRLASVSENPHPVPAKGRMPALRRADAPAHDPDPPTQGRGELRDQPPTHPHPPTNPTAGGNRLSGYIPPHH